MSDLRTLVGQLKSDLDKPNGDTLIKRGVIEAMRYMRGEQFWFNEGRLKIATVANQWNYSLPDDFLKLTGKPLYERNGSETSRVPLEVRPVAWVEEFRYSGLEPLHVGQWEAGLQNGPPHSCALFANEILLVPVPDQSGDLITAPYVRDLGTPSYSFDGTSTWTFTEPDGATPLPDDYTNEWLKKAYDLVRARATYYLQQNVFRDYDAAQIALAEYQDIVTRGHRQSNVRTGAAVGTVRGYF